MNNLGFGEKPQKKKDIGLKIHPFEKEKKDSEISDDFRSKNFSENRYGAEP